MNFYHAINPAFPKRKSQTLRIMKITAFLMLISFLTVSAGTLAQKITLKEQRAPLELVLDHIRQQCSCDIVYSNDLLSKSSPVTVNVKNASLEETLKEALSDQPLTYEIEDGTIVIKQKEPTLFDKAKAFFAQVTVTGKVQDETGQPLAGVTVKIKNTNTATATDSKGQYTINVPDNNAVLVFSFIGFETQELDVKNIVEGTIITLKPQITNLKEVAVNKGYYQEKQELLTGDVSSVKASDIEKQPVTNVLSALEGKVPGLYIQQYTGEAGGNFSVRLRGQNSIASGNDPLYLVDGVPFSSTALAPIGSSILVGGMSALNFLNPADIESIDVLKDADATAIYGSRGANGVILITTKKGKPGKTIYDFNIYQGAGEVGHKIPLLNTQQYLQMRHQALKNDNVTLGPSTANTNDLMKWDTTRYTDWQKELIGGVANMTDVQGSISGGNTNTQFLVGGAYHRESTVYPGDFADQKGSAHFNLNHISDDQKFKITLSASYLYDDNTLPANDLTTSSLKLAPDAPALYNSAGTLNWQNNTWNNPLSYTLQPFLLKATNLISNAVLSYQVLKGLQIKTNLGYTDTKSDESQLFPLSSYQPNVGNASSASFGNSHINTWILEPQAEYKTILGKGNLSALIGSTFQNNSINSQSFLAQGYSNDELLSNIQAATSVSVRTNIITNYRYASLFGHRLPKTGWPI